MTTKTLAGPKIKTALPGPNAKRILAGDDRYVSPSYTRSYPMVAKNGRGIVVTDADGNEFFDFSDRKSTRLNSSHVRISYAVFCLKKKNTMPKLWFCTRLSLSFSSSLSRSNALSSWWLVPGFD